MDKQNLTLQKQNKTAISSHNGNEKKSSKKAFLFTLSAVLVTVLIIILIFGGVSYIIIRNNVNGLASRYEKQIRAVPILKKALPKVEDPDDPKYLTDTQVRKKYQELRLIRDELNKKLEEFQSKVNEMEKQLAQKDAQLTQIQDLKKEAQNKIAETEKKQNELDEEKRRFEEKVAKKDSSGFEEFYKNMDKSSAERIYVDILKEKKANEEIRNFVQIYESMEPESAAKILEQMGDSKLDLVVDIMRNMKKEPCGAVLSEMSPKYASKVSEKLSKFFMKPQEDSKTANAE